MKMKTKNRESTVSLRTQEVIQQIVARFFSGKMQKVW